MKTLLLVTSILALTYGQYEQYRSYPGDYSYYDEPTSPRPVWRIRPKPIPYRRPAAVTIAPTYAPYEPFIPSLSPSLAPPFGPAYRPTFAPDFVSSTLAPDFVGSTFAPDFVGSSLAPIPFVGPTFAPVTHYKHGDRNAHTVQSEDENDGFGNYHYGYRTDNGIAAEQTGATKLVHNNVVPVVHGSYGWVTPEGKVISISYYADETGFHASGDAIPTPPPTPDYILRSLALIKSRQQQSPDYDYYKK